MTRAVRSDTHHEYITQKCNQEERRVKDHIDRQVLRVEEVLPCAPGVAAVIDVHDLHRARLDDTVDRLDDEQHGDVAQQEAGLLPLLAPLPEVSRTCRPEDKLDACA